MVVNDKHFLATTTGLVVHFFIIAYDFSITDVPEVAE